MSDQDKLPKCVPDMTGKQKFPAANPENASYPHACMGLNACKNLGRTLDNDCAGQGYCATTADHTCHVKNECKHQGGCGLYGTPEELAHAAQNDCKYQGSCATPINAERFSTTGPEEGQKHPYNNRGKSVWHRARELFENRWRAEEGAENFMPVSDEGEAGTKPACAKDQDLGEPPFADGPSIYWIETYSKQGMTACGSSGMSGAGSCV